MQSRTMGVLSVLVFFLSLVSVIRADDDTRINYRSIATPGSIENGKNKLQDMRMKMNLPRYGDCWTDALSDLEVACKIMDATIQSKLAFAFTSCFVEMLGFPPYLCDKNGNIQECIKNLDQRGYNTFLEYFLHTQDMCFYLTSQMWQEETDKTVNRLAFAAGEVSDTLEGTKKTQDEILKSQQEALKVQSNIMKDNNALYSAMITFKQIFDDLTVRADEHKQIFREIFEQLTIVQQVVSWIQGEMSLLDTIGFYFLALILAFVFTSSARTSGARPVLMMLYPTVFVVERSFYNLWMSDNSLTPEDIQVRLWWYREAASLVAILIVVHTAFSYRNYETLNNKMIKDMQKTLEGLQGVVVSKLQKIEDQAHLNATMMESEDESIWTDVDRDSDSESSNYSKDSDTCSNSSVSTNLDEIDAAEKNSLLLEGRQMFPEVDKENKPVNTRLLNVVDEDVGAPMLSSTPKVHVSGYNLRERSSRSFCNPVLDTETPTEFVKKLKNLRRKSHNESFFSSDDDL